jgi:hypothetical protein
MNAIDFMDVPTPPAPTATGEDNGRKQEVPEVTEAESDRLDPVIEGEDEG